ncbi:maleylpyruvate isomerase N-terminal domain-containing protein [Streptomyces sp. NPDC090306]|uniref:maleylpyruvate isomerase N-terminal domain-containing protein n=1 Tax=Streptomyces sp. NPDC090306 TaxID=3365961 RepID=UPI0037F38D75
MAAHPADRVGASAPAGPQPAPSARLVAEAYEQLACAVRGLSDEESWLPTGCTGWSVRDLMFHHVQDAQRALVALHTPAQGPPDRDAVTYWRDWAPGTAGAANGRRWARVGASMFLDLGQLRGLYLETLAAAAHAAAGVAPEGTVRTQGHVLTAGDLMTTLAVEAALHHLDLVTDLPGAPGPTARCLAAVATTLDGLLGHRPAADWSDERYARVGTGRAAPTERERALLGADADRLPLFG